MNFYMKILNAIFKLIPEHRCYCLTVHREINVLRTSHVHWCLTFLIKLALDERQSVFSVFPDGVRGSVWVMRVEEFNCENFHFSHKA